MGESPAPPGSSGRRASTWWVIGGGVACVVAILVGALLWWKLPEWKPNWVARYSPWLEPMLRAKQSPNFSLDNAEFDSRIASWDSAAISSLARHINDPRSPHRIECLRVLSQIGDIRASETMLIGLQDAALDARWSLEFLSRFPHPNAADPLEKYLTRIAAGINDPGRSPQYDESWTFYGFCNGVELLSEYDRPNAFSILVTGLPSDYDLPNYDEIPIYISDKAMARMVSSAPISDIRIALEIQKDRSLKSLLSFLNDIACRTNLDSRDIDKELVRLFNRWNQMSITCQDLDDLLWHRLGDGFIPMCWRSIAPNIDNAHTARWTSLLDRKSPALLPYAEKDWTSLSARKRLDLIRILEQFHDDAISVRLLNRALSDDDPITSERARETLLKHPNIIDKSAVFSLFDQAPLNHRTHAAILCGFQGWREAGPSILPLLSIPDDFVVSEAAISLGRLRVRAALSQLGELRHHATDRGIQTACILALSAIGDPTAAPHLIDAAADAGPEISALTLLALEHLQSPLAPTFRSAAEARCSAETLDAHLESNRDWFDSEMSLVCPAATPEPVPSAAPADP